jgi:hypothetical protein
MTPVELYSGCGQAGPVLIENVTFTGNTSSCFTIWQGARNITIKNCTYNGHPVTWEDVHNGMPANAASNNIQIIP